MIHFWREVSLAGMPAPEKRWTNAMRCYSNPTFSLAQSETDWALELFSDSTSRRRAHQCLAALRLQVKAATIAHSDLVRAFTHLYAPCREQDATWQNPVNVALAGELWFWAAIYLAAGIHETDGYLSFHRPLPNRLRLTGVTVNGCTSV